MNRRRLWRIHLISAIYMSSDSPILNRVRKTPPEMVFEFVIPQRPVSLQAKASSLRKWKAFVTTEASKAWISSPVQTSGLELMLVYLCEVAPPDIDNIIKPIQDAMNGLVYDDDVQITDVHAHRRSVSGTFDITNLSTALIKAIDLGRECVYVRIGPGRELKEYQ